jgi:hypothetical protein
MDKFKIAESVKEKLHSTKTRDEMKEKCGEKGFLDPKNEKYPIVKPGSSSCEPDCKLVHAAYVRAKQWKATDIAERAQQLYKTKCETK